MRFLFLRYVFIVFLCKHASFLLQSRAKQRSQVKISSTDLFCVGGVGANNYGQGKFTNKITDITHDLEMTLQEITLIEMLMSLYVQASALLIRVTIMW